MTLAPAAAPPTTTAREYLRVSLDRSGRARSLDEQHGDNAGAADRAGWTLRDPYRDNSVSASRYSRKVRDGFAELMADLEADRFGADVLVMWESSRGSRRVGEWVDLIDLCAERWVRIHVTTHGRTYDPRNGRDRRSLLEDAVDSEYESYKTSERVLRDLAASAAEGKPHGQTPYGYRRVYDEHRQFRAQEPHPEEAPVVAELFARIIAGHSLRSIAADLEQRGVEKRSGGPFGAAHLRTMVLNPAYAGLRVHDPGRRGRGSQRALSADARVTPAVWDGLVSEADFYAAQRVISDPARRTSRPGRGVHLLSMIVRCGECGDRLGARFPAAGRRYVCQGGCIQVEADELDEYATAVMLGYLARADVHGPLSVDEGSPEIEAARDEVGRVRAELDDLRDQVGRGALSATLAAGAEPQILARLAVAEQRQRDLTTPSVLRGLMAPGADVAERWADAPMSTRREVARLLLAADLLGTLVVHRRPEGRRGGRHVMPVAERVEYRRDAPE